MEAAHEEVAMKGKIGGWEGALDPEEEEFRTLLRDMDEL
jgi:hypothetical protein